MLPNNSIFTEVVKTLSSQTNNAEQMHSNYYNSLNGTDKAEFSRLVGLHKTALLMFQQLNPEPDARSTPPARHVPSQPATYAFHYHAYPSWYNWRFWPSRAYYPAPRPQKEEGNSAVLALLAAVLIGAAIIGTLYATIEAGRCLDQLKHAEDIFANISKLALTAFGGSIGVGTGIVFGGAVFNAPLVGAVIGCLIFSGLAITAAKKAVEALHKTENTPSALSYDPRFCLSSQESRSLSSRGYNIEGVSEALREVGICYDIAHQQSNSLLFLSKENHEKAVMVDLMRDLKKGMMCDDGRCCQQFTFNKKIFNFTITAENSDPYAPVMGTVIQEYY